MGNMTGIISKTQAQSNARFAPERDHELRSLLSMKLDEFSISWEFRDDNDLPNVRLR